MYDPDEYPQTYEQWNDYMDVCRLELNAILTDASQTFENGRRAAELIGPITMATLSLDEAGLDDPDIWRNALANNVKTARCIERQHNHVERMGLMIQRTVLDCWRPIGPASGLVIGAAKCGLMALLVPGMHGLTEKDDLVAPDVWALIVAASKLLVKAHEHPAETASYVIGVDHGIVQRMEQENAEHVMDIFGLGPPSMN